MELFKDVRFVQLRSVGRSGKYLAADTDGWHVCLTDERLALNTVWAVDLMTAYDKATTCLALRGAYGRFLFKGDRKDAIVYQAALDEDDPAPHGFLWQPAIWEGAIVLRSATGGFLSPDEGCRRERMTVIAGTYTASRMMLWGTEVVPVAADRPTIRQLLPTRPPRDTKMTLRYYIADASFNLGKGKNLRVDCNKLMQVRKKLRKKLTAAANTYMTLCIRAGRQGRLTLLLIDLPTSKENRLIEVVILPYGTPVEYPVLSPDPPAADYPEPPPSDCSQLLLGDYTLPPRIELMQPEPETHTRHQRRRRGPKKKTRGPLV
ncbi:hypothetical protein ACP4OV_015825 [Aristida adscensionis]